MGHVGEKRAERHHEPGANRSVEVAVGLGERAPRQPGLHANPDDHIVWAKRVAGEEELVRGPTQLADARARHLHAGAGPRKS